MTINRRPTRKEPLLSPPFSPPIRTAIYAHLSKSVYMCLLSLFPTSRYVGTHNDYKIKCICR